MARPGTPSSTGPAAAWQLMRSRDFGPYFAGNAISSSGTWFQNLAASLLVFRLTHSPFLLGVLNTAQFAPVLLLAPWTGLAADRFDRRRLLLVTQLSAAALSGTLALLAWGGLAKVWVVIVSLSASASAAPTRRRPRGRSSASSSGGTTCPRRSGSTR
jgi:MFS family permease